MANQLGIEAPVEPEPATPPVEKAFPAPSPPSSSPEMPPLDQSAKEAPRAIREPELAESETIVTFGLTSEDSDESAKPGLDRKRRKKRRRPRKTSQSTEAQLSEEVPEPETLIEPEEFDDFDNFDDFDDFDENPVTSSEMPFQDAEKSDSRRPKRRRRSRKKGGEKKDSPPEKASADIDAVQENPEDEPFSTEAAGGEKRKQKKSGKDSGKVGSSHRGIPSWEEAIGVIVSANMEGRSKNQNGNSASRSRGGRSRGGRKRSAQKKA